AINDHYRSRVSSNISQLCIPENQSTGGIDCHADWSGDKRITQFVTVRISGRYLLGKGERLELAHTDVVHKWRASICLVCSAHVNSPERQSRYRGVRRKINGMCPAITVFND